jgi:predicted peptidase
MTKNLLNAGWVIITLCVVAGCQKDGVTSPAKHNPIVTASNQVSTGLKSTVVETAPPVQTAQYISINSNIGGFYRSLPAKYDSSSERYPLMVFCHGIGELGNGGSQLSYVLRNGPPKLINNKTFPASFIVNGKTFSFIVISPQFKAWPQPGDILATINYAIAHYRIDTTRIYLTGLSMGGGVVWEYSAAETQYAKRLAAILPIAGASYPETNKADVIGGAHLPVWALQNQDDPTVPSYYSMDYVKYINNSKPTPNPKAILTLFAASGHDSWDEAYSPTFRLNNLNVYQWMLQYSRPTN